jgi:branched-chain amino acid transport system substrate-binding protein
MSDMFRMCGRDDQQGQVASDFIIDKLKAKRVVIIHDKDTYGQGLADATKAALAKRGVQDVMYEGLSRGEKDFNALVTKIGAQSRTWCSSAAVTRKPARWCARCVNKGVQAKFFSGDCIVNEEMVTAAGGRNTPTVSI